MPTILITGASRGIGLEMARQYAARAGWSVIATARDPDKATDLQALAGANRNVEVERLDVNSAADVTALAARLAGRPIDILLHNAGVAPGTPEQSTFGSLDLDVGRQALETNVWSVLRLTEALVENVAASEQRKIVAVSSTAGSIGQTASSGTKVGGGYMYRISKASLNMAMTLVAGDLKARGITVGLLSPGLVDTDLGRGHVGIPRHLVITTQESAAALLPIIDGLGIETTGKFIRYTGLEVPW